MRAFSCIVYRLAVVLGTMFSGPAAAWSQVPGGYVLGDSPILPDSLVESYDHGRFEVHVVRRAPDSIGQGLIREAERLFPEAEAIERAAVMFLGEVEFSRAWLEKMREAEQAEGLRWWWHRFDRIWLPFALTGHAVHYYVEALRGLVANPYGERGAVKTGSFEYRATVGYENELRVVHLLATWSYYCGSLCAIGFTHERRVYFDVDGVIQRVEGDGAPDYWVS